MHKDYTVTLNNYEGELLCIKKSNCKQIKNLSIYAH